MYKNGSGINIDKISEDVGDYKNGLEVSITYKAPDISTVMDAIDKLCMFDKLWIKYVGRYKLLGDFIERFNNRIVRNYNTFSTCNVIEGSYFKIGKVLYDIDDSIIHYSNKIHTRNLVIDIPVGSIAITPNRENLQLTESAKKCIDDILYKVKEELKNIVEEECKKDFTLAQAYRTFSRTSNIEICVEDDTYYVYISKADVGDEFVLKVNGQIAPKYFINALTYIRSTRIKPDIIYKCRYGKKNWKYSIENLINKKFNLFEKMDNTTKSVTMQFFVYDDPFDYVILNQYSKERFTNYLIECLSYTTISLNERKDFVHFFIDSLQITPISNDAVPETYKAEYKELNKKKEEKSTDAIKDISQIPIRLYNQYGYYCNTTLEGRVKDKGLIVYCKNVKELSIDIKCVAYMAGSGFKNSINSMVTMREEYIPYIEHNRKFMHIDDFITKYNRFISKVVTSYIIAENNLGFNYEFKLESAGIYWEYNKKYGNYKIINDVYQQDMIDWFKSLTTTYKNNGWINKVDIDYFKLDEKDIQIYKEWRNMRGDWERIIKEIILKKYGENKKLGFNLKQVLK